MRIAFLSDTHGNFTALQAVLSDLQSQEVDQFVFLGDAATIGSQPNETVEALRALNGIYILGNHDEAILHPERIFEKQIAEPLHPAIEWCLRRLTPANLEFIASFQQTRELRFDGGLSILCFHGSPTSNTDTLLATTSADVVEGTFSGRENLVWIGGHTHIQMLRHIGEKVLLNPGSVGHAFHHAYIPGQAPQLLPWAEYAILTVEGKKFRADMRRVPFDLEAVLRSITESGLPDTEGRRNQYWHG
jgi:putative phosphoesterase